MPSVERTLDTCIIIVECQLVTEQLLVGVLADAVQEVVNIFPSEMSPPPRMGVRFNPEFIRSMGRRGDDFVTILNMDRVLMENDSAEMRLMTSVVPQGDTAVDSTTSENAQSSQT